MRIALEGCWTALVTPFKEDGTLDLEGLRKNVAFQLECGVNIVPTGTTGESPTLGWQEHLRVIAEALSVAGDPTRVMAGTGSNSTSEALRGTKEAVETGVKAVLLIDCYYNAPSTLELRQNYYEVLAKEFPFISLTPYIIPGRTGTALSVQDLYLLSQKFPNVYSVKEATGDLERMAQTRRLLGDDFIILSGDDALTYEMMVRDDIRAQGVISVMANVVPSAIKEMVDSARRGKWQRARELNEILSPLFDVVTVVVEEEYEGFKVQCKYRNPTPVKTIMRALGLPAGPCRPPLGRMGPRGVERVKEAVRKVYERAPQVFDPLEKFYGVRVEERLADRFWH